MSGGPLESVAFVASVAVEKTDAGLRAALAGWGEVEGAADDADAAGGIS